MNITGLGYQNINSDTVVLKLRSPDLQKLPHLGTCYKAQSESTLQTHLVGQQLQGRGSQCELQLAFRKCSHSLKLENCFSKTCPGLNYSWRPLYFFFFFGLSCYNVAYLENFCNIINDEQRNEVTWLIQESKSLNTISTQRNEVTGLIKESKSLNTISTRINICCMFTFKRLEFSKEKVKKEGYR